jgi:hypothetical protein
MLPIAPCRSTLRAEREARIFSTDVVDPGSLGERPAARFVRASWMGSGANSRHEQTILASLCDVQARSTAFQTAGAARP